MRPCQVLRCSNAGKRRKKREKIRSGRSENAIPRFLRSGSTGNILSGYTAFAFLLTITHAGRQKNEVKAIAISAPFASPV